MFAEWLFLSSFSHDPDSSALAGIVVAVVFVKTLRQPMYRVFAGCVADYKAPIARCTDSNQWSVGSFVDDVK